MQKQTGRKQIEDKDEIIDDKREHEKHIVNLMIKIYCRGMKHSPEAYCNDCKELMAYSNMRVDKCPFMKTKTFCKSCRIHCFKKDMRVRIKEVMRYSGPRMIFHHPILTIQHGIESYKDKGRRGKRNT
ncbi:MAG: nitrous oxide-stimulated promoter family protein [Clostridiales bacterium]|nr:nitrous oxide-stimulated promoter family protein [Clostridiales bacterium]